MTIDCYVTIGKDRETRYRAEDVVRDLDRAGVDRAIVAPGDRSQAVYNRRGNNFVQSEAKQFYDRLIPACSISPWYDLDGIAELKRSFNNGAKMLVLNPTVQGFLVNDDLADPIIAAAGEFGMPVYVHTGPHLYGAPWQLIDCAMRFPEVNFIMGHAGATDFWNDVPYAGTFAPNVYVEGSFARPFAFKNHLLAIGPEKGVMGSSAPRNDLVYEWREYRTELDGDEFAGVFGDTLAGLLPEGGAA